MQIKITLLFSVLLFFSCISQQFTYKESDLIKQKEKIQNFVKHRKASKGVETFKIKEIIKQLNLKPLRYSCYSDSDDFRLANEFVFHFYTNEESFQRIKNEMQLYKIHMELVEPISMDKDVIPLYHKSQGKWTKEIEKFYENMEVKNVTIYETEYK